jgi:DNA-binding NarL/FixJ family response regulator
MTSRPKSASIMSTLNATEPVGAGASGLVLGKLVTSDFLTLLDDQQREIVILLSSGYRQHEIAERLGYANHSPIAKKLARIRRQAEAYFDLGSGSD